MKYKLRFKVMYRSLIIELPEYLSPVEYLIGDIESLGGDISNWVKSIDRVLSGESRYEEVNGNVTSTQIRKDYTRVINNFALEDMIDECQIDTRELKQIIVLWKKELDKRRMNGEI